MNYEEAVQFLNEIPMFSDRGVAAANFDLSRMHRFCNKLGNPHLHFPSVLVAGTNGKGTVCRMLASVYSEAGYKTGLYTSPHLLDVRERFHINRDQINKDLFASFFEMYGSFIRENRFTYFEVTTALAFWWFSSENTDLAMIEVGLGGRLDATNVLHPLVSVITSIGKDHMDILGNSITQIAREKAGIIKPNGTVIIGNLSEQAKSAVQDEAHKKEARLMGYNGEDEPELWTPESKEGFTKNHDAVIKHTDLINKRISGMVVDTISSHFPVSQEQFTRGLSKWRDRYSAHGSFEKLMKERNWYFDGAHNQDATKELVRHMKRIAPPEEWHVVLSFLKDKLTEEVTELWMDFPNVYLYAMEHERAADAEWMKKLFDEGVVLQNRDMAIEKLQSLETQLVIFSGSFYFYRVVKNWMGTLASADQINPPTQSK
jgi:dihydrofolate synthase/folylpolyglutamate synthase